MLRTQLNAY
jgi:predicted  nucleic acid-binding Zn-ribbon protein